MAMDELIRLHDSLPTLTAVEASIAVQRLEAAYAESRNPRIVPNLVGYMLNTESYGKLMASAHMREAFDLCDFSDDSALITNAFHPSTPLTDAKCKIAVHAMSAQPQTVQMDVHEALLFRMPYASNTELDAIGRVYFKAWSKGMSEAPVLTDLAHRAVHASSTKIFNCVRRVLDPINSARKPEVLSLIYGAILERSLTVANALVRTNAALLYGDVFPLNESGTDDVDGEFLRLKDVLVSDPHPACRTAACESIARILSLYSEVISRDLKVEAIKHMAQKSAFDGSSQTLRAAAVSGLAQLVGEVSYVKNVISSLAPRMKDKSQKVRVAYFGLLSRITMLEGVKMEDYVSLAELEARVPYEPSDKVLSLIADIVLREEVHALPDTLLQHYRTQIESQNADDAYNVVRMFAAVPKSSRHAAMVQGLFVASVRSLENVIHQGEKRAKRAKTLSKSDGSFLLSLVAALAETFGNVTKCVTVDTIDALVASFGVRDEVCSLIRSCKVEYDLAKQILSMAEEEVQFTETMILAMGGKQCVAIITDHEPAERERGQARRAKGKASRSNASLSVLQMRCAAAYLEHTPTLQATDADKQLMHHLELLVKNDPDDEVLLSLYARACVRSRKFDLPASVLQRSETVAKEYAAYKELFDVAPLH